jgi:predicted ABC-type ATPase
VVEAMPDVIVLAGPNGAGKSTASEKLLQESFKVSEFVNADVIARGLSAFHPEGVAVAAGRIMLTRLRELASDRKDFAFETTLASRSFAPWLNRLIETGYSLKLFFFWLPSAEMAVRRVAQRVSTGGHSVPEDAIRRRYERGLDNLFSEYMPLADNWFVCNGSANDAAEIARGGRGKKTLVSDLNGWNQVVRGRST